MNTLNLEAKRKQRDFKYSVFFLVYRPEYEVPQAVHSEARFLEIELQPLDEHDAEHLIRSMSADIELPADLKHQLIEKSAGNPFYLEEWVRLISEMSPSLQVTASLPVPKTLTALILSRIDQLEHDVKLLLQKAAVIGREFFVEILAEIEKRLQRPEDVSAQLERLEARDFVFRILSSKYSAYLFKHIITQEVAYNTLLIANRKILHRIVAEVIEEQFADNVEGFYYDLAEHYSKAEVEEKAFEYLKKAGEKAKTNYENQKAIKFYEQVIALARKREDRLTEIDYLLKKGEILWVIGMWDERLKQIYKEALCLAEETHDQKRIAEAKLALGGFCWVKDNHTNALTYLRQAKTEFESIHDKKGMGRTLNTIGNVYKELLGNYTKAIEYYQEAIKIFEELNDNTLIAGVTGNMGIAYAQQGDYDKAMTCQKRSLEMHEVLGSKNFLFAVTVSRMGFTHYLKGEYDAAMAYYEQFLKTSQKIGSPWLISVALGRMGEVHHKKGNYAKAIACYDRAIGIEEAVKREHLLAMWLINKAETLFLLQQFKEAQIVNTQGLRIAEKVGPEQEIFCSHILSAKIDFALGKKEEAISRLSDMLTHTQDEAEIARLHYELWKMTGEEDHCQTALERYRTLYKQTPKFEYTKRIEELREP
jgi:predicted ATPase